jgi:hypothetical protein
VALGTFERRELWSEFSLRALHCKLSGQFVLHVASLEDGPYIIFECAHTVVRVTLRPS